MKKSVVLYPGHGVGHLTLMIELDKVFLQHGAAVTVVLVHQVPRLLCGDRSHRGVQSVRHLPRPAAAASCSG
ncbi:hypothetical protein BAE44_0001535 [Dichanthelium oligosanthes]|uniref:Uncharacterized protein n=1 Tax=Dichanthelium oligosanthes TaxID=888268 RepID=A0A1E5WJ65_9POAL|nr:hypothetical protein BAE44_0001535 [Dichanthelium oligosanthes]